MTLITTSAALKDFCENLKTAPFFTVDTEFIRERTYWPRLCLFQLAGPETPAAAIDPLADDIDLQPFFDLLADENIIKVMHGGRQDIEIFYKLTGAIPKPLFDTQIASMVCGFGDQVAYATLVEKIAGEKIDKSSRFTDWAARPLSDKQIDYALADVTHLREVYLHLKKQIEKLDRMHWVNEEMILLGRTETYTNPPEHAWKRIKTHAHKRRTLGILQEIAAWREREAQRIDVPRGRILRDEVCAQLATNPPASQENLPKIRGVSDSFAKSTQGAGLMEAIQAGQDKKESDCPQRLKSPKMPGGLGPVVDILRVALKIQCEKHKVAAKLVANTADLEMIAADNESKTLALSGWRYEVFGKTALQIKNGELALKLEKKRLKFIEIKNA